MHRDKSFEPARSTAGNTDDPRVLTWQKDVAKSTAGRDLQTTTGPAKVTVNNITTPTMVITQSSPEIKPRNEISSKAIIGTLLGAAAGAAVAYAMTKAEEESPPKPAEPRIVSYRTIEAPRPSVAQSAIESRQPYVESAFSHTPRTVVQQIEYPEPPASVVSRSAKSHHTASTLGLQPIAAPPPRSTLIDTFIPPSEVSRYPRPASLVRHHTDSQIRSLGSHAPSGISRHSKSPAAPPSSSGASSIAHTITPADFIPAAPASVVTEVRTARDMPLPDSRATSLADAHGNVSVVGGGSVAPSDSISQAGSKKSRVSSSGGTRHSRRSRQNSSSGHGQSVGGDGSLSGASSIAHTITPADFIPAAPASAVTEVRIARDMPLPDSRATSLADAHGNGSVVGGGSVAPSDSISQAGSKKSRVSSSSGTRHSRRSRQNSKSGHGQSVGGDDDSASRASESKVSVRDNSNNSSHSSRRKRESVVSLPLRPVSHSRVGSSVHHRRSFLSFVGA